MGQGSATAAKGGGRAAAWDAAAFVLPLALLWLAFAGLGAYPTDDDFMFARPVQRWAETGRIEWLTLESQLPVGAVQTVVGTATAKAFGFSFRLLHAVSLAFTALGAFGVCWTVRCSGGGRLLGWLAGWAFEVAPLMQRLGFTFMSDGIAAALLAAGAGALAVGFVRRAPGWLLLGGLVTAAATLNRQTSAGLALAPAFLALWSWRRAGRWETLATWTLLCGVGLPAAATLAQEAGIFGPGSVRRAETISWDEASGGQRTRLVTAYGAALLIGPAGLSLQDHDIERGKLHPL